MADVYVNALTTISTEPTTTDSLVAVNRNTNEGKIIDYNLLADVILDKITSKQFSGLDTTSKLLVGAINELDSDISSLNSRLSIRSNLATTQSLYDWAVEFGTGRIIVTQYWRSATNDFSDAPTATTEASRLLVFLNATEKAYWRLFMITNTHLFMGTINTGSATAYTWTQII